MLLENETFITKINNNNIKVRIKNSKKPFYIKKDRYYSEIAQLIEIIKVEGYWNKKGNIAICNKSQELINFFETLIQDLGLTCRRSILIKIKIPETWKTRKCINVFEGISIRPFYFGRSGFTQKLESIVFETKNINEIFQVAYKDKKLSFSLTNNQIDTPIIKSYFVLKTSNISFTTFMKLILNEENSTHKIRINDYLKKAKPEIIAKVFGSVVDCDGSIVYYGLKREINLQQSSLDYIKDWNKLLLSIGINSNISKKDKLYKLTVTCNQNFKKLDLLNFELHHKVKKKRFEKILNNYKKHQVERNTALNYYNNLILEHPGINAFELSQIANKNKRTVSHYLLKLFRSNKITRKLITKQKFIYYSN
jgi:hypothetical protein